MPATDDPGAAVEHVTCPRRRRVGTFLGVAITVVALGLAVAFGLERDDDPGRVALRRRGAARPGAHVGAAGRRAGRRRVARLQRLRVAGRVARSPAPARTRVEGRSVETAFWERAGKRIAHSVVSGRPVEAPADVRRTGRRGILLRSFDQGGRTAVIWQEGEHTAVVSAIGISRAALYALAGGPRVVRPGR